MRDMYATFLNWEKRMDLTDLASSLELRFNMVFLGLNSLTVFRNLEQDIVHIKAL